MKILYKYPTRQRPDKLNYCLDTYNSLMSGGAYEFLLSIDNDDSSMHEPMIKEYLAKKSNLKVFSGNNKTKIEAINADIENVSNWDILVLVSDDMIPQVRHFDDIIRQDMTRLYPDTDGILWYFDGRRRHLNTLCILGRKYYDRFGYIYHPSYKSFWCDNEFTEVGNTLKKQTFIDNVIIRHMHPANDKTVQWDALYEKNNAPLIADHQNFIKRRALGFPK